MRIVVNVMVMQAKIIKDRPSCRDCLWVSEIQGTEHSFEDHDVLVCANSPHLQPLQYPEKVQRVETLERKPFLNFKRLDEDGNYQVFPDDLCHDVRLDGACAFRHHMEPINPPREQMEQREKMIERHTKNNGEPEHGKN